MKRFFTTLSVILISFCTTAQNPELISLGEEVYAALTENDEEKFVSAYPSLSEAMSFFKTTKKEITEEKAKEIVGGLHEKAKNIFNELISQAKKEGVSWSDLKLLEVKHEPVSKETERINVFLALDFKGTTIQLKLDDVVKMGEGIWRLTDDVGVVNSTGSSGEAEEAVEEVSAAYNVSKEQLANMIKYMATNLKDYTPAEVEDRVIKTTGFIPTEGPVDEKLLNPFLQSPEQKLDISFNESGTILEGKEIWFNELTFAMKYWDFPGWQSAGPYLEINSVRDKKGNELLLNEVTLNEYMELGLIEEPMNYSNVPELRHSILLERLLQPEEEVTILGEMIWSYAQAYEAIKFTKADIGQTKSYADASITLKQLDKNIAVFEVQNARAFDRMEKLFANKDGHLFQSHSSLGTAKPIYEAILKNNYQLSDEQVNMLAENHKADPEKPMMQVFKVSGNIDQVVFYKATEMAEKSIPFTTKYSY